MSPVLPCASIVLSRSPLDPPLSLAHSLSRCRCLVLSRVRAFTLSRSIQPFLISCFPPSFLASSLFSLSLSISRLLSFSLFLSASLARILSLARTFTHSPPHLITAIVFVNLFRTTCAKQNHAHMECCLVQNATIFTHLCV